MKLLVESLNETDIVVCVERALSDCVGVCSSAVMLKCIGCYVKGDKCACAGLSLTVMLLYAEQVKRNVVVCRQHFFDTS